MGNKLAKLSPPEVHLPPQVGVLSVLRLRNSVTAEEPAETPRGRGRYENSGGEECRIYARSYALVYAVPKAK